MAAPPMPPEMMGPPPGGMGGPIPPQTLTPEQRQIVELVMNDPILLRAILQAAQQVVGGGMAPEGRAVLKGLAAEDAPMTEDSVKMEKRILGSARRGR